MTLNAIHLNFNEDCCSDNTESTSSDKSSDSVDQQEALLKALDERNTSAALNSINKSNANAVKPGNFSALHIAVSNNQVDVTKKLLEHGADPNLQNEYGLTPLHGAVINRNVEMVILLLKNGASQIIPNNNRQTPRDIAITYKSGLVLDALRLQKV